MPNQTYASISWDDGKEIRIYHLGPGNILQEYAYSESKGRNSWHYGDLHKLGLVLDPTSSIAAVRHRDDGISLFFQDPNDGLIRALRQSGPTGQWRNDRAEGARAVKGSSIAVVMDDDGLARYRLYYQDPGLYLRERYYIPNATHWPFGDFHPGVQPRGTPITAEVVLGGDVYLNVMWRNSQGRAVVSSWSAASGWEMPNSNGGGTTLDGRD
ncbi:hypothetical protein M413DRAFT_440729 [Hebeloma cylindrosporum]|uniref:Uncharacterized protein n=1 Tax=Hebeloma cylindrosporum TaxID=76867 RepID=A0A0C2YBQ2_HEBCY|nr:hypothetical protein M413DRAFT_440729 [Hebeloma cylindrosporum h7]